MAALTDVFVPVRPDTDNFEPDLKRKMRRIDGSRIGASIGKNIGGGMRLGLAGPLRNMAGLMAGVFAGTQVLGFFKDAVRGASDLSESVNAVNVTFGDAAKGVLRLGKQAAFSVGLSKVEFNGLAVQFSNFAKTVAGPGGNVVKTMGDLTRRAADFASVMNLQVAEAATLFQSGLAGETEPLRRFGIDLSAAAVEAHAVAAGIAESGKQLTENQKVQARYSLLMKQTSQVQGDFANTSGELANQQRILGARWENFQATLGKLLLPAITAVVTYFNTDMLPALSRMGLFLRDHVVPAVADLARWVGDNVLPILRDMGAWIVASGVPALTSFAHWLDENQGWLKPIAVGLLAAVAALKIYRATLIVAAAAQAALNLVMAANPIGIVILALAGLAAGLIYAWKRSEAFRDGVSAAWQVVKANLGAAWSWIRDNAINPMLIYFQYVWDKAVAVKDGVVAAWRTVAQSISEEFKSIKGGIKGALNEVFGWINKWMVRPLNAILDPFDLDIPELPKLHKGGMVPGRGEQPYMLLGGEAVLNPDAAKALGPEAIEALNKGEAFGGWPDWASWDIIKQGLAAGANVATGNAGLEAGLLAGLRGVVDVFTKGISAVIPGPDFVEAPVENRVKKYGEAILEWAKSGHHSLVGKNAGTAFKSGNMVFPLPAGSYSVGVPINGYPGHTGQDFPAPRGTSVVAPFAGFFSGVNLGNRSYGRYASVVAGGLRFIGAHLSALIGGPRFVQAGDVIGRVGSTGNSTGYHLHAEFRENGVVRDPRRYLRFDNGGYLPASVMNRTGKPEPVFTDEQWSSIRQLAAQGATGGDTFVAVAPMQEQVLQLRRMVDRRRRARRTVGR